ncbi:hypothetical protein [Fischerella muscicola]|uniref:hypothetical protein n=1 Tax=Fischerella muscicola TaxID=92938 RepID=UPI0012F98460|nr:hypothetical protein [Fischerella muscicola]
MNKLSGRWGDGEMGRWGGGELTGPHDRQGGASAVDGFPGIKHLALGIRGNGEVRSNVETPCLKRLGVRGV